MKILFYIVSIVLLAISCSDGPVSFEDDSRVKTIYGIEVVSQNGSKDGDIGDVEKNPCEKNGLELLAFPNPYFATATFIQYNLDREKEVQVSIETAKVTDDLRAELEDKGYEIRNHTEYKNFVFYTEVKEEGLNSVLHIMYIFKPGPYLINILDEDGNKSCFPYIIVPDIDIP